MKILTVSTLYPNDKEPKHGIFVRNRLNHLRQHFPDVEAKVVAPVPWFPIKANSGPLADYAKFVGVSPLEVRDGIEVYHPRYLVIPKIGMYLTPFFLTLSMWWTIRKIIKSGYDFDVIDGHYFFPDGVAISKVANWFKKPFTVTARGTDVNLIPQYPKARKMVRLVAEKANHAMTVCQALKDSLLEFASVDEKTTVLRNGVDLEFFTATSSDQQQELKKQQYAIAEGKKLIVSVGHLIERKGHYLVIEAMQQLDDCHLIIAGDGPDRKALEALVDKLSVADRVTFAGALAQTELRQLYQGADALVLASSREGWANVLLESMACGTAVVATNLWGTPEVVAAHEAGVLVERSVPSIAKGLETLFAANIDRLQTRKYAEGFDWYSTSKGQHEIFSKLLQP